MTRERDSGEDKQDRRDYDYEVLAQKMLRAFTETPLGQAVVFFESHPGYVVSFPDRNSAMQPRWQIPGTETLVDGAAVQGVYAAVKDRQQSPAA